MKKMIVKIPEQSIEFVTKLLEKLCVKIEEPGKSKTVNKPKTTVSPTYLFGKWKDLEDIKCYDTAKKRKQTFIDPDIVFKQIEAKRMQK